MNPSPVKPVLSVLIPVYNERYLVEPLIERVEAAQVDGIGGRELVVVDDASTDGTGKILDRLAESGRIQLLRHETNRGKGAALRTAIDACCGDLVIFQDADHEYDPEEYSIVLAPILDGVADVVFGSRFAGGPRRRVLYYRHALGNRLITMLTNWFSDFNLTDIETCYKAFRTSVLRSIPIRSNGFGVEPELTLKVARRGLRLYEVPISYAGRTYQEGKKINWKDAVIALITILRFSIVDDIYQDDEYGSRILRSLEKARRFNSWMAETVRAHLGGADRILEVGAGIGNISRQLIPRDRYLASDINPHYIDYLRQMRVGKPYFEVEHMDLQSAEHFAPYRESFDGIVCLNVLEHVPDPAASLLNLFNTLEVGGRLVLYVPQSQSLFSSLDEVLEHRCRYEPEQLRDELEAAGFEVEIMEQFNRVSRPAWWWNGRVLKRRAFGRVQLKIFDVMVPLLRRIDPIIPWRGLGLLAVARKRSI